MSKINRIRMLRNTIKLLRILQILSFLILATAVLVAIWHINMVNKVLIPITKGIEGAYNETMGMIITGNLTGAVESMFKCINSLMESTLFCIAVITIILCLVYIIVVMQPMIISELTRICKILEGDEMNGLLYKRSK